MEKARVAVDIQIRPDPKTWDLNTGVKNVIVIDGFKIHVDSRVYLLLKHLDKKPKATAKK